MLNIRIRSCSPLQPLLEQLLEEFQRQYPGIDFPPVPPKGELDLEGVKQVWWGQPELLTNHPSASCPCQAMPWLGEAATLCACPQRPPLYRISTCCPAPQLPNRRPPTSSAETSTDRRRLLASRSRRLDLAAAGNPC